MQVDNSSARFFLPVKTMRTLKDLTARVVSLPERQDRRRGIAPVLEAIGLKYSFEDAICPLLSEIKPEWIKNFWDYKGHGLDEEKYIRGSAGCKISHLNAIRSFGPSECALILEDDVDIDANLWRRAGILFDARFARFDDWDIVYLGGFFPYFGHSTLPEGIHPARHIIHASAYVLSPRGIQRTLDKALDSGKEIDLFYRDEFAHMDETAYVILPFAARQVSLFQSDIR